MTHDQWQVSRKPREMLELIREKASPRKLRLYAVACCRLAWGLLTDLRSREAIEAAERFADGEVSVEEMIDAGVRVTSVNSSLTESSLLTAVWGCTMDVPWTAAWLATRSQTSEEHASLLRDTVGDPFVPAAFDPAWRTPTVIALARAAYTERLDDGNLCPDRLAVLADALEEEGCVGPECRWCYGQGRVMAGGTPYDPPEAETCTGCRGLGMTASPVLAALRATGPHYRGHWALDLILGKE